MNETGPEVVGATLAREALVHADALYAYAHYLARDAQGAQDLVQETFARCMVGAQRFVPGTALKAWLFRILRNAFIDLRRRETHNPVRALADYDSALDTAPRADEGAHAEQLRGLVAADIESAMRLLPEPQRSVVLLDLEGFSESEMADVLGCAQGTIKSRLARARAALREQLKEYAT